MGESLLKKEFKEKDVNRLRNLITKKYGSSASSQVGHVKKEEEHKEGDIWEEQDKEWTIKNGIKQSHTKLDKIKATIRMPLTCPCCNNRMKGRLDTKMYSIHTKCHSCVIEMESKLKRDGKYEQYVIDFVSKNLQSHIDEAEQFIMEFAESKASKYITEAGDIEETVGDINKTSIIAEWRRELEEMREKIKANQS